MLKILKIAGLLVSLTASGAFASDEQAVTGLWQSEANKRGEYVTVAISPCPDSPGQMCGFIKGAHNKIGSDPDHPLVGMKMLWGLRYDEERAKYTRGKIKAPDTGDVYSAVMQRKDEKLRVEGCVFVVCRGQDWTRVLPPAKPAEE